MRVRRMNVRHSEQYLLTTCSGTAGVVSFAGCRPAVLDGPGAGAASVYSFLPRPVRFLRTLALVVPPRAARTAGSIL